ncbi:MAG TPA: thiamine phosphate synthase, partial [Longimicrobiales bacterium]
MIPQLHLVTDDVVLQQPNFIATATELLLVLQRRMALHIRGRSISAQTLFRITMQLMPRAQTVGAALIVNDRVDIALAAGASGVQLGARSLPVPVVRELSGALQIGYSAHRADEALQAERDGANFLFAGSIYPTLSHPGVSPGGLPLLES